MDTTTQDQTMRDGAIRDAQNKVIARMKADPDAARSTLVTVGRIDQGLTCAVTQGKFSAVTDLGHGMGGDAAGPSPGFYARTAIVGCVGMGIKMLAAREGLTFDSMEVTVETDFDDTALFGLGSSSAAPLETRVKIHIESAEDPAAIRALVNRVLEMDPWFLALRDAQVVRPTLKISGQDGAAPRH
ncbi:MAG: OsmC family protein [Rhodobacteraceae bacterium]|nr:OsmC family protein [Paracoccaceae bacterium]